jgi:hypothetical protein
MNNMTREERKAGYLRAMAIINGRPSTDEEKRLADDYYSSHFKKPNASMSHARTELPSRGE